MIYDDVYKINREIAALEEKRNTLIHAYLDAENISYQEFEHRYGFVYQQKTQKA